MKFVADAMLGRLARWMRILGYDVTYVPHITDEQLIELSISEERIIITRDTLLARRRTVRENHLFIHYDDFRDQLREVIQHFPIPPGDHLFSRCMLCNIPLVHLEKSFVKDKIPSYVFETQEDFASCPSCGRIYWHATHAEEMERTLRSIGITR